MKRSASRFPPPRRPIRRAVFLAAAAVLAAVPVTHANAATIAVTNCANSGAGSLRNAASVAASGDVINMTGLACNRILLGSTITFPQNRITLRGPGRLALTVSAGESGRVFTHTGSGTLRVERLSVAYGRYRAVEAYGGCIRSAGGVELIRSRVHHCRALRGASLEPYAAGGGVFAGRVLLSESIVRDSLAEQGAGGGVFGGDVTIERSEILNNEAYDGGGVFGGEVTIEHSQVSNNEGGGVYTTGPMTVTDSLIHNNQGVGLHAAGSVPAEVVVRNSTISSNWGAGFGSAIHVAGYLQQTRIIHSTISGNSGYYDVVHLPPFSQVIGTTIAFNETLRDDECSEAVTMFPPSSLLVGSIVARNTCLGGAPADIRAWVEPDYNWGTLSGGRNLIGVAEGPVPGDTIFGNPLLGPLADNGGPTPTHLPASNSPAIDSGSNLYAEPYDQRGPGFWRTKDAIPDIGAVER
jgi:hypothetical protein